MLKFGPLATLALLIASSAVPAQAQGTQVNILGCVSRGVEGGCLIITDSASKKSYQINSAVPAPDPAQRLVVRLRGTMNGMIDFCQQGPVLSDIKWTYTKMRCERPKAGAMK